MSKKLKKKAKKGSKSTKVTKVTKSKKTDKKAKKTGYKRGDLGRAIYAYFDEVGVDEAKYDKAEAIALKVLPRTKFNKYHFSWYKNQYRLKQE